ncbi:Outer envelope pore protein 37, chloroplastic [Apostasia shenzhenica]|uniref:Outer envelope pore protein 37, chloroplastic n=1 Tax=Apostasia shenzhenica TaxID=1088818 RepID=A0A2I0BFY8_9ASPA|nr:Outer envelope pore protein 37, chloroplastic [Apostasia shenzhenica]
MGDATPPSPNPMYPLTPASPPSDFPKSPPSSGSLFRRPPLRYTSEFDSESPLFLHKFSSKFFDSLAKLKLTFKNDMKGEISCPQLSFRTENLSIVYDVKSRNALLKGSLDLSKNINVHSTYDIQEQLGVVGMVASLPDPPVKLELSSLVPTFSLPRATLGFPFGEVALEQREDAKDHDQVKKVLSVSGILRSRVMNGLCTVMYNDNSLNLRYLYKDEEMSFIPSIHLPSKALSIAFKRRFSPLDKLSYCYHFDSSNWSAVYKHAIGADHKFKAGYDSDVRLVWASLWVGPEDGKAKAAPMKLKAQIMLQVPQDDIRSSALMFRVKKRWDF